MGPRSWTACCRRHLPFHQNGEDFGGMCMLGTFSEYSTISENSAIKVDPDLPLDKVS